MTQSAPPSRRRAEIAHSGPVVPQRSAIGFGGRADGAVDVAPDSPAAVFELLAEGTARRLRRALVTIVAVEGGSARPVGTQLAVLADGSFAGYLSGGCIEAAIALEAVGALTGGRNRMLRIGRGSPYLDLTLPCGGGMDLYIAREPDPEVVAQVRQELAARRCVALAFDPATERIAVVDSKLPEPAPSGWSGSVFVRHYAPRTRLVLIGGGIELETTARLAAGAGFEVAAHCSDAQSAAHLAATGIAVHPLDGRETLPELALDAFSAVVTLFHDLDREMAILRAALASKAFLVGALGGRRTHQQRCERLLAAGVPASDIARIKGPVGLFGPSRDAASLAISILAQVTLQRPPPDA